MQKYNGVGKQASAIISLTVLRKFKIVIVIIVVPIVIVIIVVSIVIVIIVVPIVIVIIVVPIVIVIIVKTSIHAKIQWSWQASFDYHFSHRSS